MTIQRRSGLGRGLGQLIQSTDPTLQRHRPVDEVIDSHKSLRRAPEGSYFAEIPVNRVTANPRQPRSDFDKEALAELVESVREVGLLQPIVVRPLSEGRFELVMGERRWRAVQQSGQPTIPAIVRRTEDHDLLRDALLENLHRAQLNPLEEANAYQQLLEDFGCTHDELSARIKRSRPQISNTIRLLKLPPSVQRRVAAGALTAGHARSLLGLDNQPAQERLAQRIVDEGLSVRATEQIVALSDGDPKAERSLRTSRETPPRAAELTQRLSDHFDTRARVDLRKSKGRIVIEFASGDDLERIISLMRIY